MKTMLISIQLKINILYSDTYSLNILIPINTCIDYIYNHEDNAM